VDQATYCFPSTMPVLGENIAARQCSSGSISRASSTEIHRTSTAPLRCALSCNARSFSTCSGSGEWRDHPASNFVIVVCRTVCTSAPCLLLGCCNHDLAKPLVRDAPGGTVLVQHVAPCLAHPCLRLDHAPIQTSSQFSGMCQANLAVLRALLGIRVLRAHPAQHVCHRP
jgi:hypothetical protein